MKHQWAKEPNRTWTICKVCTCILRGDRANENEKCKGLTKVRTRKKRGVR